MRRTGWRNYSLFMRADGLLFGYFEAEDSFAASLAGMLGPGSRATRASATRAASAAESPDLIPTLAALACVLPMHSLEPFLLMLSSVFVPLFGVILGRLGWRLAALDSASASRKVDATAVVIWVVGIAVFHGLATWAPQFGSALPSLALTLALGALTRR